VKEFFLQQASIISILIWVAVLAFVLYRLKKIKAAKFFLIATAVLFYLFSTAWLPRYLAYRLEKQYPPLKDIPAFKNNEKVYIHLLGSGYQSDKRLSATSKLSLVAQGRFTEAMRLYHGISNSVLVCSANAPYGGETQAEIARDAALALGADGSRILLLDKPATTKEEAKELVKAVGKGAAVLVVTDAIHMPRAMKLFTKEGLNATAAPTNFKALNGSTDVAVRWWPSEENIYITDRVLHEYFASVKAAF
jgi:uncharacterized SAM-binding protein YcdF (DUF218 family)